MDLHIGNITYPFVIFAEGISPTIIFFNNSAQMNTEKMEFMSRLEKKVELGGPKIIFFVSSFCSKCAANQKVLEEYFDLSDINQINIADPDELVELVHPSTIPTHLLIDPDGRIIYYKEGLISTVEAKCLANIWKFLW